MKKSLDNSTRVTRVPGAGYDPVLPAYVKKNIFPAIECVDAARVYQDFLSDDKEPDISHLSLLGHLYDDDDEHTRECPYLREDKEQIAQSIRDYYLFDK